MKQSNQHTFFGAFILLIFTAALSACGQVALEPTSLPTAVPATHTPTSTPTPSPTVAPILVKKAFSLEGQEFFQTICDLILEVNPLAGCPIVAREDVPLDHQFVGFTDAEGKDTGFGVDLDADPAWCGQEEFECDWYLYMSGGVHTFSGEVQTGESNKLTLGEYDPVLTDEESVVRAEEFTEQLFQQFGHTYNFFEIPVSSIYEEVLAEIGLEFRIQRFSICEEGEDCP